MRLLNNYFLKSLVVVLIENRSPITTWFIDESVKPRRFPFEPSRDGVAANLKYFNDLVDGMP